jgi:hypothetical protein
MAWDGLGLVQLEPSRRQLPTLPSDGMPKVVALGCSNRILIFVVRDAQIRNQHQNLMSNIKDTLQVLLQQSNG